MKFLARVMLAWAMLCGAAFAGEAHEAPAWVLSATGLGPLKLYKGATVSEAKLKQLFPGYNVSYEIEQGNAPAFHYFEVTSRDGRPLFGISSFPAEGGPVTKTAAEVPIDLLQVYSPLIPDAYGLRVGDHMTDILARRGKNLEFGASHDDAYIGGDMIYYGLAASGDINPTGYRLEDAIRLDWEIRFISWPEAAWE